MTTRAEQIWKAFCGEITREPTDDMREALSTAVLMKFCKKYGLDSSCLSKVLKGKFKQHKGWKVRQIL